ncbi:MAG: hypothetical protein JNM17_23940 [Archangium sp.]|nr:hypothetical protein [Archangium sp.]
MHALPLALALLVSAPPAAAADSNALFEKLKKLEGSWKSDGKDGPVQYVTIRLVANGTSVLETTTGSDRVALTSVTVYAFEGTDLMATNHGSGGGSKLKASSAGGDSLKFDGSAKDARVASISLVVKDNKLRQEWTTRENGREVKKSIELLREYVDTLK